MKLALGAAEDADVSERLIRCQAHLEAAIAATQALDAEKAHRFAKALDLEIEPLKPFSSLLPDKPNIKFLQQWASDVRCCFV